MPAIVVAGVDPVNLPAMRFALPLTLCVLALAACNQPNQLFQLVTIDTGDGSSDAGDSQGTGAADTTAGSDPTPTSTDGPGPVSTSGPGPVTTTDPGPDQTTGMVMADTTTSDETAGTGSTTLVSMGSTTGGPGDTTDGETSDQTTLNPVEMCAVIDDNVYVHLYPLCAALNVEWTGSQNQATFMVECDGMDMLSEVHPHAMVDSVFGPVCDVLELIPYQTLGGGILGQFKGIALPEPQGKDAELYTEVLCTSLEPQGTCDVQVAIWVDKDMMTQLGKQAIHIKNGQMVPLKILLSDIPGVSEGQPFSVILDAKITAAADAQDRVYFVNPRIRQSPG